MLWLTQRLKNHPAVFNLNAAIKARAFRSRRQKIIDRYDRIKAIKSQNWNIPEPIRAFKSSHAAICSGYRAPPKGKLRIFWIGANVHQDEQGFLQSLKTFGPVSEFRNLDGSYAQHFVDKNGKFSKFNNSLVLRNDAELYRQLRLAFDTVGIDVIIAQTWRNYFSSGPFEWARAKGVPFINMSMDDKLPVHWESVGGIQLGAVGLRNVTDIVLTTSKEACDWYRLEDCPAIFWPLGSDPNLFKPRVEFDRRDIPVLFIGNRYGIRANIMDKLEHAGHTVTCFGAGWKNGSATALECIDLFARAKIILGVGTVGYCDDVFTMKLRDFDATMSGALYLTSRSDEVCDIFKEGVEIECYSGIDECDKKLKHYLENLNEAKKVAEAGRKKALNFSWDKRLGELFSTLGLLA